MASSSPQFVLKKDAHHKTVYDTSAYMRGLMGDDYISGEVNRATNIIPDTPQVDHYPVDKDVLNKVNNPDLMREWLEENYYKVASYHKMKSSLMEIIRGYIPGFAGFSSASDHTLESMINSLDFYLQEIHRKILRFNVELGELSGSEMAARIENHKKRVMEVIDDYDKKLRKTNEEILQLKVVNADIHRQLMDTWKELDFVKGKKHRPDDVFDDREFRAGLKFNIRDNEQRESSILEDLAARERQMQDQMKQQAAKYAKQLSEYEEECLQELAFLSQDYDVSSLIEKSVHSTLEEKSSLAESPNKEDSESVIQDWLTVLREAIHKNRKEITVMTDRMKNSNEEMSNAWQKLDEVKRGRSEHERELRELIENLKLEEENERMELRERLQLLKEEKLMLTGRILELDEERDARLTIQENQYADQIRAKRRDRELQSQQQWGSPAAYSETSSEDYIPDASTLSSGGYPHGGSPSRYSQGYPTDSSTESPGTPYERNIHAPGIDSISPRTSPVIQRRSPVSGGMSPQTGTGRLTPGTQSPRNYQQNTSIERTRPRMADSPMRVEHRAQTTPRAFKTPMISTARFAYTDPTARFLNRDDFVFDSGQPAHPVGAMYESPEMTPTARAPHPYVETPKGRYKYAVGRRLFAEDYESPERSWR